MPGLKTEDGIADIGSAWAAWSIDPGKNALGIPAQGVAEAYDVGQPAGIDEHERSWSVSGPWHQA